MARKNENYDVPSKLDMSAPKLTQDEDYMRPVPPLYYNQSPSPTESLPSEPPPFHPTPSNAPPTRPLPDAPPGSTSDFPSDPVYQGSSPKFRARGTDAFPSVASGNSTRGPRTVEFRLDSPRDADTVQLPVAATDRDQRGSRRNKPDQMDYLVNDVPPWYLCILLGFQHFLIMFGATLANPLVLADPLCIASDDSVTKSYLIGTIFVTSGVATFLQATIGVRLPVVQGGTFTFVAPSFALLTLDKWDCNKARVVVPAESVSPVPGDVTTVDPNTTAAAFVGEPLWLPRIRELQGAIIVASLFQVIIGCSGVMGFMLRFIGPLAISPTISLAGLALFDVASNAASKQWWITLVTVVLIAAFSQYTKNIDIPCFTFERGKGCHKAGFSLFRLFPVILAMSIAWIICAILIAAKVFSSDPKEWGYANNTALYLDGLGAAPWFRFPYPGQWGVPTVSAASIFGMLAAVLAGMVESVGDYYACARISGAKPPPMHAINRGIAVEGIACVLCGAWGSSSGTTTYSENIGAIGITKVSSRRVIQCAAVIMVIFGIFGKLNSFLVSIPDPVIGGVFIVMFGMVTAVGISNLQFVNLNSSRNLFIIGFSFFFGLTLPKYLVTNKGAINTGNAEVDQVITVLLSTSMFVGGLTGFVLDNTIPGTDEERGLLTWREHKAARRRRPREDEEETETDIYDIPILTRFLKDKEWAKFVPFFPTFNEQLCAIKKRKPKRGRKKKKKRTRENDSDQDLSV